MERKLGQSRKNGECWKWKKWQGNGESHFLLLLSQKRACDKFPPRAEEGMLSSPCELGGPAKTEPLLTESMGGWGKITRGVCQSLPTARSLFSLSSCCCQPSGKTPSGPGTVMRERKSKWETDKHRRTNELESDREGKINRLSCQNLSSDKTGLA